MSTLWVEGQVVQLNRRPGARTAFLTLRDPDVDMSLSVSIHVNALDAMPGPLGEGARVVLQAKPVFWTQRGSLMLDARQIRPVGVGELLARLEYLKRHLAPGGPVRPPTASGRCPSCPAGSGSSAGGPAPPSATSSRTPAGAGRPTRFEIRQVAVQGTTAVAEVIAALAELDAHPEVDVIVIARGGGGVEDLLPFSNETLVRAVAAARTPVVSAIGHDVDTPLLDLVADHRASTPTDAAKAVVPDADAERAARRRRPRARPARAGAAGCTTSGAASSSCAAARCSPTRAPSCAASARSSRPCASGPAAASRRQLHRARDHARAPARAGAHAVPAVDARPGVRDRPAGATARSSCDPADLEVGELLRVRVARGDFGARPSAPAD